MKITPELIQLFKDYHVYPLDPHMVGAKQYENVVHGLKAGGEATNPQDEELLSNAGYVYEPKVKLYIKEKEGFSVLPNGQMLWTNGKLYKVVNGTEKLVKWLGRHDNFFSKFAELTGGGYPEVKISDTPGVRPTPLSPEEKILKTVKAGSSMKADAIIDLYNKAKELKSNKLMNLVKTLKPLKESMTRKELKSVVKEIVSGIFKEMTATAAVSPVSTPKAFVKKNKQEEEKIDEMTTTGAVSGYNVPGAFSRKGGSKSGVEGSAALGYDLTPIGKQEMERPADKLK